MDRYQSNGDQPRPIGRRMSREMLPIWTSLARTQRRLARWTILAARCAHLGWPPGGRESGRGRRFV